MNTHWLNQTSDWLDGEQMSEFTQSLTMTIQRAEPAELEILIDLLSQKELSEAPVAAQARKLLQLLATRLVSQIPSIGPQSDQAMLTPSTLQGLYEQLLPVDATAAGHAMQCLAAQGDEESLAVLAETLEHNPPRDWQSVGLAISPMWILPGDALDSFFQRLQDSEIQASTLTVLLDLANHSFRTGKLDVHPWVERNAELAKLLSQVVVQLEKLQTDPGQFGTSVEVVQQVLADSISLTVALCDTLGLIGLPESTRSLTEAMDLAHRRIQAEAAAALARLGDERGNSRLVALAADPVCRSRVVHYAEELDMIGAIDEKYRVPQALAESDLVAWLASGEQYGLPPTTIEHLETRTLYWPGFEEPRDCYLFKFTYQVPQGVFSNIGMAGPLTRAFASDLTGLAIDDQYAAFAGWQAEHDEIFEVPVHEFNEPQRQEADRLKSVLSQDGFQVDSILALTFMLGETALLARMSRDGQKYVGISDGEESVCIVSGPQPTAISPDIVLAIYRGRKLLKAFN